MELVFASHNIHKLKEIRHLIGHQHKILGLIDIGCFMELPENQNTIEGNASEKANYIYNHYKKNCFADDSGLEIYALNGSPGVYSAHYAGLGKNEIDHMNKVLNQMHEIGDRRAQFRTVISLIVNGKEQQFEGIVSGVILPEPRGFHGFGYDPIFQPEGMNCSFAEMSVKEKNRISHRGRAVQKLVDYLKTV